MRNGFDVDHARLDFQILLCDSIIVRNLFVGIRRSLFRSFSPKCEFNPLDISTAQAELRRAFMHGGPGTIVSGFVWLAGGIVASSAGIATGFAVLFFGGMFIFPITEFIVRGILRREAASKANPGGLTVIETIFPMIGGLLAAWLLLPHRPDLVFPMAAIAVGAHYFGFRTAYGDWTFWVLGAFLCLVGIANIFFGFPPSSVVPYVIAGIELAFGVWLLWVSNLQQSSGD